MTRWWREWPASGSQRQGVERSLYWMSQSCGEEQRARGVAFGAACAALVAKDYRPIRDWQDLPDEDANRVTAYLESQAAFIGGAGGPHREKRARCYAHAAAELRHWRSKEGRAARPGKVCGTCKGTGYVRAEDAPLVGEHRG